MAALLAKHGTLLALLRSRSQKLTLLRSYWQAKDLVRFGEQLRKYADPAVSHDVLKALRVSALTPEALLVLLPCAEELLGSSLGDHPLTALKFLQEVLRTSALIREDEVKEVLCGMRPLVREVGERHTGREGELARRVFHTLTVLHNQR